MLLKEKAGESTKVFNELYNGVIEFLRNNNINSISKEQYLTICENISFLIKSGQYTQGQLLDKDLIYECLSDTCLL